MLASPHAGWRAGGRHAVAARWPSSCARKASTTTRPAKRWPSGPTTTSAPPALAAAQRKVGTRTLDSSREAQAKLSSFLARRGFGWDAIRPTLKAIYVTDPDDLDGEED